MAARCAAWAGLGILAIAMACAMADVDDTALGEPGLLGDEEFLQLGAASYSSGDSAADTEAKQLEGQAGAAKAEKDEKAAYAARVGVEAAAKKKAQEEQAAAFARGGAEGVSKERVNKQTALDVKAEEAKLKQYEDEHILALKDMEKMWNRTKIEVHEKHELNLARMKKKIEFAGFRLVAASKELARKAYDTEAQRRETRIKILKRDHATRQREKTAKTGKIKILIASQEDRQKVVEKQQKVQAEKNSKKAEKLGKQQQNPAMQAAEKADKFRLEAFMRNQAAKSKPDVISTAGIKQATPKQQITELNNVVKGVIPNEDIEKVEREAQLAAAGQMLNHVGTDAAGAAQREAAARAAETTAAHTAAMAALDAAKQKQQKALENKVTKAKAAETLSASSSGSADAKAKAQEEAKTAASNYNMANVALTAAEQKAEAAAEAKAIAEAAAADTAAKPNPTQRQPPQRRQARPPAPRRPRPPAPRQPPLRPQPPALRRPACPARVKVDLNQPTKETSTNQHMG